MRMERMRIERRAIAQRAPIVLHLPFPPGRDRLFVKTPEGRLVRTTSHEDWRAAAEAAIRRSGARRMVGPVEILMVFRDGGASREIGDLPMACLGILASTGLIMGADSRNLRKLTLCFGDVPGAAIEIREFPPHPRRSR